MLCEGLLYFGKWVGSLKQDKYFF